MIKNIFDKRAILEWAQFPFIDKSMDEWYLRHKDLKLSKKTMGYYV